MTTTTKPAADHRGRLALQRLMKPTVNGWDRGENLAWITVLGGEDISDGLSIQDLLDIRAEVNRMRSIIGESPL
jgi:hypothetical protein